MTNDTDEMRSLQESLDEMAAVAEQINKLSLQKLRMTAYEKHGTDEESVYVGECSSFGWNLLRIIDGARDYLGFLRTQRAIAE